MSKRKLFWFLFGSSRSLISSDICHDLGCDMLSQMKYCIVYEWITGLLWGCSKSYEVENRTQQCFWVQRWCTMLPCSCIYNRIWFICYRFSHFADWNGFVVCNHSLSKSSILLLLSDSFFNNHALIFIINHNEMIHMCFSNDTNYGNGFLPHSSHALTPLNLLKIIISLCVCDETSF